jgi:hypothetical protein
MAFISATRLHLRSKWYFLQFQLYVLRSALQLKRSKGFRGGILGGDAEGGAWTVTAWDSDADMRAFRNAGAHRAAMPHLLNWCDEASYTHWPADTAALPPMEEAYQRLSTTGKISKVNHPSAAHAEGRTVSEGLPRVALNLKPRA